MSNPHTCIAEIVLIPFHAVKSFTQEKSQREYQEVTENIYRFLFIYFFVNTHHRIILSGWISTWTFFGL